ncbi:hypothetical protein CMZ84_05985 [Lysobacteraceae bacterium NML93-0399]|nr:hypothetical protein CMZ84_05985 [Xanthomonadaceae bacterium NML93-0399]
MPYDLTPAPGQVTDSAPMHTAAVRARIGDASLDASLTISTRGLLAVGALVSGILLATSVIVLTATRRLPQRRWPF